MGFYFGVVTMTKSIPFTMRRVSLPLRSEPERVRLLCGPLALRILDDDEKLTLNTVEGQTGHLVHRLALAVDGQATLRGDGQELGIAHKLGV